MKIELKETLVDLRKRFAINDYGGLKNKAAEKGAGKLDFQLGVKHKKQFLSPTRTRERSSRHACTTQ